MFSRRDNQRMLLYLLGLLIRAIDRELYFLYTLLSLDTRFNLRRFVTSQHYDFPKTPSLWK